MTGKKLCMTKSKISIVLSGKYRTCKFEGVEVIVKKLDSIKKPY